MRGHGAGGARLRRDRRRLGRKRCKPRLLLALLLDLGGRLRLQFELGIGTRELLLRRQRPLAVLVGLRGAERLAVAHDGDAGPWVGAAGEDRGALGVNTRDIEGGLRRALAGLWGCGAEVGQLDLGCRGLVLFRGCRLAGRFRRLERAHEHPRAAEQHQKKQDDRYSQANHGRCPTPLAPRPADILGQKRGPFKASA